MRRSAIKNTIMIPTILGIILGTSISIHAFFNRNNQPARVVVGHGAFSHKGANGEDPYANTLYNPWSVYTDGTKLFVADRGNYRVLIYSHIERGQVIKFW